MTDWLSSARIVDEEPPAPRPEGGGDWLTSARIVQDDADERVLRRQARQEKRYGLDPATLSTVPEIGPGNNDPIGWSDEQGRAIPQSSPAREVDRPVSQALYEQYDSAGPQSPATPPRISRDMHAAYGTQPSIGDVAFRDGVTAEDYGRAAMSTAAMTGAGFGWALEQIGMEDIGSTIRELGQDGAQWWQEGMTDAARQAMSADFLGENADWDLHTIGLHTASSIIPTMLGMGTGMVVGRSLGALGNAMTPVVGRGMMAGPVSGALSNPAVSGAIGYGIGEAAVSAPMAGLELVDAVMRAPIEQLMENDAFRELYESLPDNENREITARGIYGDTAGRRAAALTGATTFSASAPAGALFGRWAAQMRAARYNRMPTGMRPAPETRAGAIGAGMGAEFGQEFVQSGAERLNQNIVERSMIDSEIDLTSGVANAAVGGGLSGAVMGGAFGAATPINQGAEQEQARQDAIRGNAAQIMDPNLPFAQNIQQGIVQQDVPGMPLGRDLGLSGAQVQPGDSVDLLTGEVRPVAPELRAPAGQNTGYGISFDGGPVEQDLPSPPPNPGIAPTEPLPGPVQAGQPQAAEQPVIPQALPETAAPQIAPEQPAAPQPEPDLTASVTRDKLPSNLQDPRLQRREYRESLQMMLSELYRGGGDMGSLVPKAGAEPRVRGELTGDLTWDYDPADLVKTPSLNPQWFQSLASDTGLTVEQTKNAVNKALQGKKLGLRQAEAVERMLHIAQARRTEVDEQGGPAFETWQDMLRAYRDRRRPARGQLTDDQVDQAAQAEPVESLYDEDVYTPEMSPEARWIFDMALQATPDIDAAIALLESQQTEREAIKALWQESQNEATRQGLDQAPGSGDQAAEGTQGPRDQDPAAESQAQDLAGPVSQTAQAQADADRARQERTDQSPDMIEGAGELFAGPRPGQTDMFGPKESAPIEPPAEPEKAPQAKNRKIGRNANDRPLFEDENGVRYYIERGMRISEPVLITPGGMSPDPESRGKDFLTPEEWADERTTAEEQRRILENAERQQEETAAAATGTLSAQPESTLAEELASLSDSAVESMFDEAVAEVGAADTSKPRPERERTVEQTGKPRKSSTRAERTNLDNPDSVDRAVGEIAKSFGHNISSAGMNGLKGLTELFGGRGKLSSGLTFDEQTYAKAKPHFQAVLRDFEAAGKDVKDFMRAIAESFGAGVKPYLVRFVQDLRAGRLEDGNQIDVPDGDARTGAGNVQGAPEVGQDGRASAADQRTGSPDGQRTDGRRTEAGGRGADRPSAERGRADRSRNTDRVSDRGVKGENYHIEPGALAETRGRMQKARDNIRAIELVKQIEAEGRPATKEEQQQLSLYVGWGGLKGAFPDTQGNYEKGLEKVGEQLRELLTDTEYATARRSIQYAHYTAENVVSFMWQAAERMGFKGGKVFEPGMGTGNFAGLMPPDLAAKTDYNGLELDHMTARIARLLYPKWGVRQDDFTKAPLPKETYDLEIGNPPFGDIPIKSDAAYPQGFLIHDYFFAKGMDGIRPGGAQIFVTSAGTLNKIDDKARKHLAKTADLVLAVRLPGNAFEKNAGTSVTTDIIILRKRLPGEQPGDMSWLETTQVTLPNKHGEMIKGNVNRYFIDNPDLVLGEEGFFDPLYENRYGVRAPKDFDLGAALNRALGRVPENIISEWSSDRAEIDFGTSERKEGSYYIGRDGRLMQQRDGVGTVVERRGKGVKGGVTAAAMERIQALIPIRDALRAVYQADLAEDTTNAESARERLNKSYDAFVAKFGPINKANFQYRRPNIIQQESARAAAREEARYAGDAWSEGSFDSSEMVERGASLSEIARARREARKAAEAAGQAWDEGSFDPSDMPDIVTDKRPNIDPFMGDPESYRLRSIERYNDNTGESSKGDIFTKNIIRKESKPVISSVEDAVLFSLNQRGRLDMDLISREAGMTESEAIEALGEKIFLLPGTENQWVSRDEYLSGNVRRKLRQAKAAAARNREFERNVSALEAVQPIPLPPSEIDANLGMPWIPESVIEQFMTESLGLESGRVTYIPALGQWNVGGDATSVASVSTFGTVDKPATKLLQDALNRQDPKIYREIWDQGRKTRQLDPVATEAAQEKIKEMKERFSEWVWSDQARANELADLYNEEYNSLVDREYNGDYLTTPGINSSWSWRPHQRRVIARIIQSGNTYMAHGVGAGKTSAMIGAGMEMRRLGLVRKPMYAVPNDMLQQFTKEFYEQYPTAKIMVADEQRFHTDRRKQFVADAANEDLDAIIITHSAFGLIPVSGEFQDGLIQKQIDEYREILSEVEEEGGDNRITRSRMEKQIERLEQRLTGKSQKRKDEVFTFEEMGVDFLFMDEAHMFRKLDFATKMGQIKGIASEGSKASWDLYVKTRYLEQVNPGRSLVLASGTPVTNTMAELYTVSRYLQPQALKEKGLEHFDAWAGAFGDTVSIQEQDPAGGYKLAKRFARFVNVPELSAMVRQNMDVVTSSQLAEYVTRPELKGGQRQFNLAEKTEALDEYQAELAQRMEIIANRRGPPEKGDDILLNVINDGRHASIDMRLVDPALPNDPGSKLNLLVDNVFDIWEKTKRAKFHAPEKGGYSDRPIDTGPATQIIFANLGLSGARGFSVPDYIRSELTRRGVPDNQIANITDYKTHVAKQRLFNDINEGKVRVLIGSTTKIGKGLNVQRRLYAVHNLDPLWFPADDEQRNGRIIRQGNMNPVIEIHDYSTKGTYDATMWSMMETKARFIQAFFEGDPTLRNMDDLGQASQYEQAKAMTTADPRLIELTELRQKLERAKRKKTAFERDVYANRVALSTARDHVEHYTARIPAIEADIAKRTDTKGDAFRAVIDGKTIDNRVDAGDLIMGRLDLMRGETREYKGTKVAEIGGFDVMASAWGSGKDRDVALYLQRDAGHETDIKIGTSSMGLVRSVENALQSFDGELVAAKDRLQKAKGRIEQIKGLGSREFTGQAEIDDLTQRVKRLEKELMPEDEGDDRRLRPGSTFEIVQGKMDPRTGKWSGEGGWHVVAPGGWSFSGQPEGGFSSEAEAQRWAAGESDPEANYSFAGEKAEIADRFQLRRAQERIADGQDPELVRQETGWFRGDDGRWRFEIDDSKARIKMEGLSWGTKADLEQGNRTFAGSLGEILHHPQLFAAYPDLYDLGVHLNFDWDNAGYTPGSLPSITVGYRDGEINLNAMLHEIQHGIQTIEGFAVGGSPDAIARQQRSDAAIRSTSMTVIHNFEREVLGGQTMTDLIDAAWDAVANGEITEQQATQRINRADRKLQRAIERNSIVKKIISRMPDLPDRGPFETYQALAGEIEARNVQARQSMNTTQRRETSPDATRDIPADQAIVVWGDTEMASVALGGTGLPQGSTPEAFEQALGRRTMRALTGGNNPLLRVVSAVSEIPGSHPANIAGVYLNGTAYVAAGNVKPGAETGLVLHEIGVHVGLKDFLGDRYQPLTRGLMRQVERGGKANAKKADREAWEAHRRARVSADGAARYYESVTGRPMPQAQYDAVLAEETWAYMAESGADSSLLQRFLSAIKTALIRMGLAPRFVNGLSNADVAALARGSVARIVDQTTKGQPSTVPAMYSAGQFEVVQISGDVFGEIDAPVSELKRNAREFVRELMAGQDVINRDDGSQIHIPWQGLKHALGSELSANAVRAFARIDRILESSRHVGVEPDRKGRPNIKAIHIYEAQAEIGGELTVIRSIVRETTSGRRYYDHFEVAGLTPLRGASGDGPGDQTTQPTRSGGLGASQPQQPNNSIKADRRDADYLAAVESGDMETAQRMVDQAAEEAGYAVGDMYHGSPDPAITEFEPGREEPGVWFTSNRKGAGSYIGMDGAVYKSYLRPGRTMTVTFDEDMEPYVNGESSSLSENIHFAEKAEREGYDSLHFPEGNFTEDSETWVVFGPNQIKSADPVTYDDAGNVIPLSERFQQDSPDIRYSISDGGPPKQDWEISIKLGNNDPGRDKIEEALERAGLKKPRSDRWYSRLQEATWGSVKNRLLDTRRRATQGSLDRFYGLKLAEQEYLGNLPHEQSAYVAARLSTGIASTMRGLLHHGAPEWRDGIISRVEGSQGLLEILRPVKGDLNAFLGWMVGRRAERLLSEGRENLFDQDHIDALIANGEAAKSFKHFEKVAEGMDQFKKRVLDVAEQAGLIDPAARAAWDHADYVPFYRVVDQANVVAERNRATLSGQRSGIRTLKGGAAYLNDPLENLLMNLTHLMDASMKNHAIRQAQRNLDGTGVFEDVSPQFETAIIPMSQVKKRLKESGVDVKSLPREALEGLAKMWALKAPGKNEDVVRIMDGGKGKYYRITDPLLLRSLTAVRDPALNVWPLRVARSAKRILTRGITADPAFMARNFMRDMLHAWTINEDHFKVGIDSIRGAVSSVRERGGYIDMAFAGASFMGGYVNANDPGETSREIRRALRERGYSAASASTFVSSIVDTPLKFWEFYTRMGDAVENSSREAVYEAARKAGKSRAQAVFESKDLMDYSMRGDWAAVQALTDVVPFLNARVQGNYKLARAGALNPLRVTAKGMVISLASLALLARNEDDERYQDLEEWDKDTYWHVFLPEPIEVGGTNISHVRIPKPFEVGVIFATIPERIALNMLGQDDNDQTFKRFLWNIRETLAFDPMPQIFAPGIEVFANWDRFRDRPIESFGDRFVADEDRYNAYTSPVAIALGRVTGDIRLSPKEIEHLWHGYTGTMGMYALSVADLTARYIQDAPPRPKMRIDQYPVIKSFLRSEPARSTKWTTELYRIRDELNEIHGSLRKYEKEGNIERWLEISEEDAKTLDATKSEALMARDAINETTRDNSEFRKQIDMILTDESMTPEEKREWIDELISMRNTTSKETVQMIKDFFVERELPGED